MGKLTRPTPSIAGSMRSWSGQVRSLLGAARPKYYAPSLGRPSLPPGLYFRCFLVGYFDGKKLEVEAATMEANAAMKTIVRPDNGAG